MNAVKLPGQYAKFLTAIIGQALVFAQYTYGSGNKWVTLATAAAGALGVLAVPNTPKPPAAALPMVPATGNVTVTPPVT